MNYFRVNITLILFCIASVFAEPIIAQTHSKFNRLIWSDEFDCQGNLPDTNKWNYNHGNGCPSLCGWGNDERQFYTVARPENAQIRDGRLIIKANKEQFENHAYTSARLTSRYKGDWTYGRIEIRAKLPTGRGIWPAIWMLPSNPGNGGWPMDGEIDIMENVGYWPDSLFGTVHTGAYNGMKGTQQSKGIAVSTLSKEFHTYSVEWDKDQIVFMIDHEPYHRFTNDHKNTRDTWPFDQPFHLVMNVAVGGHWGGKYGVDDQIFPQQMEVEFVRVYQ